MKQKQSHSIKASNLKKGKNARDQVPLEKVKQKLVFKWFPSKLLNLLQFSSNLI